MQMKKHIVITFLSSILLCTGCVSREKPYLRIAVTSDAQAAASENHWGIVNTEKAFRFLARFNPDVLVMAGDLADRVQMGQLKEYVMDVLLAYTLQSRYVNQYYQEIYQVANIQIQQYPTQHKCNKHLRTTTQLHEFYLA